MTPQDRLELVTTLLTGAGARITTVIALADPGAPHDVVAHRVAVSSPTPDTDAAARAVLAAHAVPTAGLVPWVDPDAPSWDDLEEAP